MTCNDPLCAACQFQREHPEEQRASLIFNLADTLRYLTACMTRANEKAQAFQPILEAVGAGEEGISGLYNQLIENEWKEDLTGMAKPLLSLTTVLFKLLPPDLLALTEEVYHADIRSFGAEQNLEPENTETAVTTAQKVELDILRVGDTYLQPSGVASPLQCSSKSLH